jgi:hypothetical protein
MCQASAFRCGLEAHIRRAPIVLGCLALLAACSVDERGLGSVVLPAAQPYSAGWRPVQTTDASAPAGESPEGALPVPVPPDAPAVDDASVEGGSDLHVAERAVDATEMDNADARFSPVDGAGRPQVRPENPTLVRGLILHLLFDDGRGRTFARDASGHANVANLVGLDPRTSWVAGRFGGALLFSGGTAGGWLQVASAPIFHEISAAFTISVWVQGSPGADVEGMILSRHQPGARGFLYAFDVVEGHPRVQINSGNGYFANVPGNMAVQRGSWAHLAVTFDSASVRIYVDGRPAGSGAYVQGVPLEVTPLIVGAGATLTEDRTVRRFIGRLDEVMLYSRALSADEVAALARGAYPRSIR